MKILKRILIGLAGFFALLVIAAMVLPIMFKGKIKEMVDAEIAKQVNADVVFDVNNFSLSIFRNFPNVTVEVKELGVFNRAPFEGIHLFVVDRFDVEVNLKDILFGDQLRVKGITLVRPQINVKVLKDGRANYDITFPSTDTVKTSSEPSKFSFAIDRWSIENAEVVYDDETMPIYLSIGGLNHSGSGNFNDQQFDLTTKTTADSVSLKYGGAEYLSNKRAEINAVIGISENYTKYTFKENLAKLNDFALGFDGWFKMNEKDFGMDINFKSPENSFKSILSLVPGMYSKNFGNVETKGDLSFTGFVKGTYSDKKMPAFNLDLKVKDAMFKYPSLPAAVTNIAVDLLVDNKTGVIDNTVVDLKKFHIDFGSNPVDARVLVENLKNYKMDAVVKAKVNLAEMSQMFPMEGMDMKGIFAGEIEAKGVYDAVKKIPMSGNASLKDFRFTSKSLAYATTISNMEAVFDPKKMELKNTSGTIGKSDFKVSGSINNYMEYVFGKGTIAGTMNFNSTLLDLNEFMTSEPAPADKKDTTKLTVIPVPQNIDFLLHSDLKTVKMMDYVITNAAGDIVVKDGTAKMNNVKFNMLGGAFVVNGTYDTKDLQHPKYDFGLKVDDLSIQQAATTFSIIKTYAPIAGMAQGKFGTDFKINGELGQDMMPKMNTVNGDGLIKIAEAAVTNSKLISGVTSLTKLQDADNVTLKNVLMSATIKDGKLSVKPFNAKFGSYVAAISGSTALDGTINYAMKMNVPAGKLGAQFQSLIGSSTPTSEIPLNIGMGGTFLNPKLQLVSSEQKQQVKEAVKTAVTNVAKDKAKETAQQLAQGTPAKDLVNGILGGGKKDSTKTDTTKVSPVQNVLQNKLQNLLKKKKN
ncbi:MAG TPA: AsmA-like C-terminal region-containing protein [Cyclobacteriaceae bacterium]|nr:AsmA-like C-terminal region-containing protein [Cyclobacteriaceae bacterium]